MRAATATASKSPTTASLRHSLFYVLLFPWQSDASAAEMVGSEYDCEAVTFAVPFGEALNPFVIGNQRTSKFDRGRD